MKFHLELKIFVFIGEKMSVRLLYYLIQSHSLITLQKAKRCRNFCARIFRNFARSFDKSELLEMRLPLSS